MRENNLHQDSSVFEPFGFLRSERYHEDDLRIQYKREGLYAKDCKSDNIHTVELHYHYNGSGPSSFGGAKQWPCVTAEVCFKEGEEKLQQDFAVQLANFIDAFMRARQR